MKKIWIVLISLLISACAPGQFLGPTITPSPTATAAPTITPSPMPTLTPTQTPVPSITPSPTPVCSIKNGSWSGDEIVFEVSDFTIISVTYIHLIDGQPFYQPLPYDEIPITDRQFHFSNAEPYGDHIFSGEFDSDARAHGELNVPTGFFIAFSALMKDVTLEWEATPEQ